MRKIVLLALLILPLAACTMGAENHRDAVSNADKGRLTVASAQREIHNGMSSAEVVEALGSPNMVTTDDQRRETWVYDKVSTEKVYSTSSGGLGLILFGFNGGSGASSTTQRTLTIIVKFDDSGKVRDYAYRSSTF